MSLEREQVARDVRRALAATAQRGDLLLVADNLEGSARPAGDAIGLDSEDSVGFVCDLEDMGYEITTNDNLLIKVIRRKPKARTVDEIVDCILRLGNGAVK